MVGTVEGAEGEALSTGGATPEIDWKTGLPFVLTVAWVWIHRAFRTQEYAAHLSSAC
jgi:hypothetical protein